MSQAAKRLINVFTLVETVVLTAWAILLALAVLAFLERNLVVAIFWFILAFLELYLGLLLEHRLAAISNKV